IARDLLRDRGLGLGVDVLDQLQRKVLVLPRFLLGVIAFLQIEIGDDAQERRPDVDAFAVGEFNEAIELGLAQFVVAQFARRIGHRGTDTAVRWISILTDNPYAPYVSGALTMPAFKWECDPTVALGNARWRSGEEGHGNHRAVSRRATPARRRPLCGRQF